MMPSHSHANENIQDQNEIFYSSSKSVEKNVSSSENQPFVDSSSHKSVEIVPVKSKYGSRT